MMLVIPQQNFDRLSFVVVWFGVCTAMHNWSAQAALINNSKKNIYIAP